MRKKYADLNTQWSVMDVQSLDFQDSHFDIAIDKVNSDVTR